MDKDYSLFKEFEKKWEEVELFEKKELQRLSIEEKFRQVESLIRIGMGLGLDFSGDKEIHNVRSRWLFLKKGM